MIAMFTGHPGVNHVENNDGNVVDQSRVQVSALLTMAFIIPLSRKISKRPVKARFWPWLEPFSVRKSLKPIEVVHSPPAIGLASEPNAPNRSTRAGEETLKWLRTSPLLSQSGLLFDPVTPAPPLLALNPTPQNPEP